MDIKQLARNWDAWGKQDAMYAVLTDPAKRHNGWDKDEFFALGRDEIAGVLGYLRDHDAMPAKRQALDFGCGVGRLSQALADTFDRVTGVDIAPSMVQQARSYNRHGDHCRYVVNAVNDLSQFETATFDFVYSNIVLQHMRPEYAHAYVREFFRLLRPDGVAVFFLPEPPPVTAAPAATREYAKDLLRQVINRVSGLVARRVALPQIDMFGTPREQVETLVRDAGGRVLDVVADRSGGQDWVGYRYCCRVGPVA